jgi:hypothetical protein
MQLVRENVLAHTRFAHEGDGDAARRNVLDQLVNASHGGTGSHARAAGGLRSVQDEQRIAHFDNGARDQGCTLALGQEPPANARAVDRTQIFNARGRQEA